MNNQAAYPAALSAGEVLRRERERRSLGLREVARILGTSPTALSELERGHFRPGAPLVTALAEHYRLDVWELLLRCGRVPVEFVDALRADPAGGAKRLREMVAALTAARAVEAGE